MGELKGVMGELKGVKGSYGGELKGVMGELKGVKDVSLVDPHFSCEESIVL